MDHPKFELISFPLCPFVMRAKLLLRVKGVTYHTTDIDLDNKPDWFLDISPLGKVPVLRVDDDTVVFESQVICEYLDDITPDRLHSDDPLKRAQDRAWIEFATQLIFAGYGHLIAGDPEALEASRRKFDGLLGHLEGHLGAGPFFHGDRFMMVDAAYAPFFVMMAGIHEGIGVDLLAAYPRARNLGANLRELGATRTVVPEGYVDQLIALLRHKGSALVG